MASLTVYLTLPEQSSPKSLDRMANFVAEHHPSMWKAWLLNLCWLMEVEYDGSLVALVWFSPLTGEIIEAHACADPAWRGRWITREVLHRLTRIIDESKCSHIVAQVTSPLVARIWRRVGFKVHKTIAILTIKDTNDG